MSRTRGSTRPTRKDIAAAAGVSQAAGSMVLYKAKTPYVPTVTRTRILKVADDLGYQPHHAARTLRSARTVTPACVVPDITNPFYPGLVRRLQTTAAPAGYGVLIYDTGGKLESEPRALRWLRQGRADGVVGTFFHLQAPAPPDHGDLRLVGMWLCSGNQTDARPHVSASIASSCGGTA